ncbi:MAG: NADH-quinone oxidoreductase subunit L [Bdellovibrionales bacterium]|nr:NADH-quinone oxidoreductase subunit L [Bdellovibrionales bacterium]
MLSWIVVLPLIGFLINGLWYAFLQAPAGRKKAGSVVPGAIATAAIFGSFLVSLSVFLKLNELPESQRVIEQVAFSWMKFAEINVDFGFRVDVLSTLFTLVITGVGTLIHLYSIGYMSHDETPTKFFAYLNLFCFAMLILVTGSSLPILFLGWEGVGLCSYLLIGYWYKDEEKASAGKKAFIVNRVGDFGFILGMFLIYTTFGTLDFVALKQAVAANGATVAAGTLTAIGLLLFVGCMGKSAQIPLYVWLPDAMAGPTPVSALIHAATMVTSGVYMVSRLNFIYSLSPTALGVVATVGALTAFFAATIAIAQTDIKKVLAYSTVSQLGYMFLACGVGAYTAGVFHVITHAFFKALLFLGAGSVIHGMHEEQDILKMGGLKSKMPKTWMVFAAGWLAICGIPPFSGFFSKDEILWEAMSSHHGSFWLWLVGALTAMMTAFYMTRLYTLTFLGKPRFKEGAAAHAAKHDDHGHGHHDDDHGHGHGHGGGKVHESPAIMVVPLQVLAVLSIIGGFMGIPHASWLAHWLDPVIPHGHAEPTVAPFWEWVLMGVSVAGAGLGIFGALKLYAQLDVAAELKKRFAFAHRLLENKWFVDELYEMVFVKPIYFLSQGLWKGIDVGVIDRFVVGLGKVSMWTGQTVRVLQTGSIQTYAFVLLLGLIMTLGYFIYGMV